MNLSVVFYVPNIIDYTRIILLIGSIFTRGTYFIAMYALSVSLDYFDGLAARKLNQVSILGGALDMIIDRVSTMVILSKIAVGMPSRAPWCILYSVIDFMSHFIFFLVAAYTGMHHKNFSQNPFLSLYYQKGFLYLMCLGSELCFVVHYLIGVGGRKMKWSAQISAILVLIAVTKTFFHVVHFIVGTLVMSSITEKDIVRKSL